MRTQDAGAVPPLVGTTVRDYQILELIGRGGMGEVYRALDLRLDRPVAVKVLSRDLVDHPTARRRFLRETRIASRVVHPYVATVFDVVEHQKSLLLVMEYIEGRRLDTVFREDHPSVEQVRSYGLEIAEALSAIHSAGLIHRDLKPGNVMVTSDGHVKVMDFGLARPQLSLVVPGEARDATTDSTLTHGIVGTPSFMSPEQVRGEPLDPRSDLFSLGVILFQGITGVHPFQRASLAETLSAILSEPPGGERDLPSLADSGQVSPIVQRLLEKERERRYQSARDVVEEFRRLSAVREAVTTPRPAAPLRGTLSLTAVAVLLIAVVFAIQRWGVPLIHRLGLAELPSRAVIAVLPFSDKTSEGEGEIRGEMLADLLSADLTENSLVRPLASDRIQQILVALPPGASSTDKVKAVQRVTPAEWLVGGTLYKEGGSYEAAVEVYRAGIAEPFGSFRVAAGGTAALVDLATGRLRKLLFPRSPIDAQGGAETEALSSSSEEAGLLAQRAKRAMRELKYLDEIEALEGALRIDPRFISAQIELAEALYSSGFGSKASEAVELGTRLVKHATSPVSANLRLRGALIEARIHEDTKAEIEAARALVQMHPDDPESLRTLSVALWRGSAFDEAISTLDRAIQIDATDPSSYLLRARILSDQRRPDDAHSSLARATKLFETIESKPGLSHALEIRGDVEFARGEYKAAGVAYAAAAEDFEKAGYHVDAARSKCNEAHTRLMRGDLAEAQALYAQALPVLQAAGDFRTLVNEQSALGGKLFVQGDLNGAERQLREAVSKARDLGNSGLLVDPLLNLASLLSYTGRVGESRGLALEALEAARARKARKAETTALTLLASGDFAQGRLRDSIAEYRDVVRLGEGADGENESTCWAWIGLAEALEACGSLAEASDAAEKSVTLADQRGERVLRGYARVRRTIVLGELLKWDEAAAELKRIETLAGSGAESLADLSHRVVLCRGLLALMRGRWEEARVDLETARAMGDQTGADGLEVPALVGLAQAALYSGRPEAALRLAKRAVEHPKATAVERTLARAVLARTLVATGKFDDAADAALRALDEADAMGQSIVAARAAAVLASLKSTHRIIDKNQVRSRGRALLEGVLDSLSDEYRSTLPTRSDLREVFVQLSMAGGEL